MNPDTNDSTRDTGQIRPSRLPIVVGVAPHQSDLVVLRAAELAVDLGSDLICAYVDSARYEVEANPNGSSVSLPFDPDLPELSEEEAHPAVLGEIQRALQDSPVRWSLRVVAGDPAHALTRLANTLNARLIVVGSREGTRAGVQELFGSSVAVHLAHRQHRPVLVVPVAPTPHGTDLHGNAA